MRHIVQIIPANGWHAVLAARLRTGEVVMRDTPLACWALVEDQDEDGTWRDVVGLTAEGELEACDLKAGFVGYLREGDDLANWRPKAERLFAVDQEVRIPNLVIPGD